MVCDKYDTLKQEIYILMGCVSAAASYLQEIDMPWEQTLSKGLVSQQVRVLTELENAEK